ncbi:Uncharacterised protein [Vibrio cholerae]|nr:Uncharacterised protein [Vibrio cholerae]
MGKPQLYAARFRLSSKIALRSGVRCAKCISQP